MSFFASVATHRNRNVAALFKNASSRMRFRMTFGSKLRTSLKISGSGLNRTLVPFFGAASPSHACGFSVIGPVASPRENVCENSLPPRHTVTSVVSLSAFTTDIPTPWSPPLTWYPLSSPPNFPPA